MAHLIIQYSSNLKNQFDAQALCNNLHQSMADAGFFPLGGIRVRCIAVEHYAIADLDPKNGFVDMELRMGVGRSIDQRKSIGEALMLTSRQLFEGLLNEPHFALSLEVREIDKELSWKTNSIHPRLNN
ncbi:MAG: 5-carboxymethyl-2-hydroxymuconate Delta-isomerase [Gammaproteobacteria bacterium]|nr:5-carboxymethyl-2-hydroxymuconate Delta-isomerase [Gammaproteobacteria bacterium]